MKKNTILYSVIAAVIVVIGGITVYQVSKPKTAPISITGSSQALPVIKNPIVNTSQVPGLTIVSAMVENNVDPTTSKTIGDRLQLTLKNSSTKPMTKLDIYYAMKDAKTNKTEGYYKELIGLTLAAGSSQTIYFDNQSGANHYPENKYSLYRTSQDEVDFSIEVSAAGFKTATATAVKSPGTGESANG